MRTLKSIAVTMAAILCAYGSAAWARPGGVHAGHSAENAHRASNWNSPKSSDRDKGLDRAEERRSEQGAEHNQVGHPKKHAKKGHEAKVGKGKYLP
jgi:hypothetical protein